MFKFKISTKVLLFFLTVSLVPIVIVTFVLLNSAKHSLLNAATTRQQLDASNTAQRVDDYLGAKVSTLVFQSQILAARSINTSDASEDLAVLMKQDSTLETVALLDATGNEEIAFNQQGQINSLTNMSSSDAYKAVSYLSGKDFISSVTYNSKNEPEITIAVPLLKSNLSQNLNDLPAASIGTYTNSSDIQGVLVASYNISGLWQSVLSLKIGHGGYAYVVDGLGNLVAYPNSKFLAAHPSVSSVQAVSEYINGDTNTEETISETGQKVVSTPKKLSLTNWAVIVEEPVTSIDASINSFLKFSAIVIIIAMFFSTLLSLIFRRQLTSPIKKLMVGVKRLEGEDFDQTITLNSRDEFQELATTFNTMALSIKKLFVDLKSKNFNLSDEQTRLSSIIRSVTDGIIALNNKGQIISINPPAGKLIHKDPQDLLNKNMLELYPLKLKGKEFNLELKKPGLYHYTDLTLQHGSEISYLDLMVTVIDRSDSEVSAIITIHDLTQGRELDVMKLDFVAIAAHELRTPVTVIQGYLSLISKNASNQLTISNLENLQKAIVGTKELGELINKLLNVSRIDRGEMDMHFEKLDLVRVVDDVVKQHEATASTRNQTIIFNPNDNRHVYVPGDASSLTEVLNNLMGNALKYTDNGDDVKVNLLVINKDEVRVEIVDNGPGISAENRAKLFTKFYRVERSLVAGNRGTGLGLYMSKSIIDQHHGKIGVESDAGHGSVFFFTLPIFDQARHGILITENKVTGGSRGWFKKRDDSRR